MWGPITSKGRKGGEKEGKKKGGREGGRGKKGRKAREGEKKKFTFDTCHTESNGLFPTQKSIILNILKSNP